MVMILSLLGILSERTFKNVVFPADVPPLTIMEYPEDTRVLINRSASGVMVP